MNWKPVRCRDKILFREKTPYEKCPNCSKYKFTIQKRVHQKPGIIFGRDRAWEYELQDYCKNCDLRQNKRKVTDEEIESVETSNKVL